MDVISDLEIPQKFVGMVIGSNGQTIGKLKQHTGAEVLMVNSDENQESSIAQVTGTQEQVDRTVELINRMVESGRRSAAAYQKYMQDIHNGVPREPLKVEKLPGLDFLGSDSGL